MKKLILQGFFFVFLAVAVSLGAAQLSDSGWIYDKDENSDGRGDLGLVAETSCRGSLKTGVRYITLHTDTARFHLRYFACVDPAHLKEGQQCHGKWGLSNLGLTGWYPHSFMDFIVNDISLQNYLPVITSEKTADAVTANYRWETPAAKINMEFRAEDGHDYLSLKVTVEPKKEIFSVKSAFICYPGSIAPAEKRDRWISTAERNVQNSGKVALTPNEQWILYYDKIWDRATKPGCTPCALFYPAMEPEKAEVNVGDYVVTTNFNYPGQRTEINYMIWAEIPKANQEALEYMKTYAEGKDALKFSVEEWLGQLSVLEKKLERDRKSMEAIRNRVEQAKQRGSFMPGEAEDIKKELFEKMLRYIDDNQE